MKLFYRLFFFVGVSLIPATGWGQSNTNPNNTIQGSVVDVETNEPLPGVSVAIKGTVLGTATDIDGKFLITVKEVPVTLTFSLIGFRPQEVEVFEASEE